MKPIRQTMHELARARADTEGPLAEPYVAGNLAVAGSLAVGVFLEFEWPANRPRVSRAVLRLAAAQALRSVD